MFLLHQLTDRQKRRHAYASPVYLYTQSVCDLRVLIWSVFSVVSGGGGGRRLLHQWGRPQVKVQGWAYHLPLGALQRLFRGLRTQCGWSQKSSGGETSSNIYYYCQ